MKLTLRIIAICLLGCLGSAPTHAATAEIREPTYARNVTFIYSNGRVERFVSADKDRLTWRTRSGRSYERHRSFFLPVLRWDVGEASGSRTIHGRFEKLWPLKVGNTTRFRTVTTFAKKKGRKARRTVQNWLCTVPKRENMTTRAGDFDAFRIECERYSADTMRLLQRDIWHYAPTLRHYIHRETISYYDGQSEKYTLTYAVSGLRANARRVQALLKTEKSR
jgi:hypothetical protein